MKKLIETITLSNFTTNYGIFTKYLNEHSNLHAWLYLDNAHSLDIEYYLSHSGDKYVSPLFENLEDLVQAQSSGNVLSYLGDIIATKFSSKWNNIYKALESDNYDPLIDYSEISTRTPNITKSSTQKTNSDFTVTQQNQQNGDVYGYNSATSVPAQKVDGTITTKTEGDKDDNYVELTMNESGSEITSRSGTNKKTKQELMNEEVNVRNHIIWNIMMNDVDSLMCCNVYLND